MSGELQNFFDSKNSQPWCESSVELSLLRSGRLFPEIQTNWVVVTGPPSAGKTTSTTFFEQLGLPVSAEAAAQVVTEALNAGFTREQVYDARVAVARQHAILSRGLANELALDPDQFRLLDRSWLDAIPFSAEIGVQCGRFAERTALLRYHEIVYLEALPLAGNAYRPDDAQFEALRTRVDQRSREFWANLGYNLKIIPAFSPAGNLYTIPERLALVSKALGFGTFVDLLCRLPIETISAMQNAPRPSPFTEIGRDRVAELQ